MKNKTLIINICNERLHYFEFVKPIEDILKNNEIDFQTIFYKKITDKDLFRKKVSSIIICGTSLKDNEFLENLENFRWLKHPEVQKKHILGICGGMQVISLLFNEELQKNKEIGEVEASFIDNFLGMEGKKKIYALHNNSVKINKELSNFNVLSESKNCVQGIKHKTKEIYGVLFHPEVRNKNMIVEFCRL